MARGAIVIGGYVNGLGLVRALAARGILTAVVTTKPFDIAQHSSACTARAHVAGVEDEPERLVEHLLKRGRDWSGAVVYPTNDEAMLALAENAERLSAATYRVVAPPVEVARALVDKRRMVDVARRVGVDRPRCYGPAVAETAALPELAFPVVVKPTIGYRFVARFGCKLFVADDRRELDAAIERLAEANLTGEVYDLVPGPDDRIYAHCLYVDRHGEPSAGVTVRKIRQGPPFFGVARVAEVVADPPGLREATIEILRVLGHRGIAVAEFKHDPRDGRFRFIEVNGRSVLYNALLRKAGLDHAALAWTDLVDGAPERVRPRAWPGVWIHLHADVLYGLLRRHQDPLSARRFLAPYARAKIFAVWSAADPAPFFAQWRRTAREGIGALRQGRAGDAIADPARSTPIAIGGGGRRSGVLP